MSIAMPSAQKPVQLYLWTKCGYCTKQKAIFDSMNSEMRNWMMTRVKIITVQDPKMYPSVKGYPFWVVNGRANPGFKSMSEIMSIKNTVDGSRR